MTTPQRAQDSRWLVVLSAALTAILALLLPATPASAMPSPAAETRVGAFALADPEVVGVHECITAGQRPVRGPSQLQIVVGSCVAAYEADAPTPAFRSNSVAAEAGARGGAGPVRLGQAGEDAVRGAYDIGPKTAADINGRSRIFDGLTDDAVSEVKNVGRQSLTRQLRDDIDYARANGLRFDLYVRPNTNLSGPLVRADLDPFNPLNIRYIP